MAIYVLLLLLTGCSSYVTKEELPELIGSYLKSHSGRVTAHTLYAREIRLMPFPQNYLYEDGESPGGVILKVNNEGFTQFLISSPGGRIYLDADDKGGTLQVSNTSENGGGATIMSQENSSFILIRPGKDLDRNSIALSSEKNIKSKFFGTRIFANDHRGRAKTIYRSRPID